MCVKSQYTLQLNKSIVKDIIWVEQASLSFLEGSAPELGCGHGVIVFGTLLRQARPTVHSRKVKKKAPPPLSLYRSV